MKKKKFQTTDLFLSAALQILTGIDPEFETKNGTVLFCFDVSDDLYRAMSDYNSGIQINAFEYTQAIKKLRTEMFKRRK